MERLFQKIIIKGKLECLTGLHIGDSKESTDIGGVDSPVVRRKDNNQPYIPGSSLKGKMRCLLEQVRGENADAKSRNTGSSICQLFGASEDRQSQMPNLPSRIIVRDASMTEESVSLFKDNDSTDLPYTEIKFENVIDRIKGTAMHPRQQERVPAGASFDIEFVINVFADSLTHVVFNKESLLATFNTGISLLNDDYLGGSGTRGYGHVKISLSEPEIKNYATT